MRKIDWKAIDWLPLSVSALVLVSALWTLSAFGIQPNPESQQHNGEQNKAPALFAAIGTAIDHNGPSIEAASTVVVAIFTVVLAWSTGGLWDETKRSVRVAERAMVDLERAYVFFDDAVITPREGYDLTGHRKIQTVFKNHGKTPAIIISRRLACCIAATPPSPRTATEHTFPSGAVIGHDECWKRGEVTMAKKLEAAKNKGCGQIYLYGDICYRDILGNKHRTWFCREFNGAQFVLGDLTAPELNGYC